MATPRDLQDEIRKRLERTQRAAQQTAAGAGQTLSQRGSLAEARARGGAPRTNAGAGISAGLRSAELTPDALTPEERASLQRQTQPRPAQPQGQRIGGAQGIRTGVLNPADLTPEQYQSLQRQAGPQAARAGISAGLDQPAQVRPRGAPSPERIAFEQQRAAQTAANAQAAAPAVQAPASPATPAKPGVVQRLGTAAAAAGKRVAAAAGGGARFAGGIGAGIGALKEGFDVANVARDEQATTADVVTQASEGAGRLASAGLGAAAGAKLGALGGPFAPFTVPAGAIIGGGLGYLAADEAIGAGRELLGSSAESPVDRANARAAQAPGAVPEPIIIDPRDPNPPRPPSIADSLPDADINNPDNRVRTGRPEVLGTFTGGDGVTRTIDSAEAERLAGQLQVVGDPDNGGAFVRPRAPSAAPAQGGGVQGGNVRDIAIARIRDIQDPRSAAGQLYARLAADKTPTGKRLAAQFLSEYLGTGNEQQRNQTSLQVSANQVSAQMAEQEARTAQQIAAAEAAARRPNVRVGPQGQVISIADGLATQLPVIDARTGRPVAQSPGGLTPAQRASEIRQSLESGLLDEDQSQALRRIYNQLIGAEGG